MKNILISQKIILDKHKQIIFGLEGAWFNYFKNKKINLIPLNYNNFNKKKLINIKPQGLILSGGNDLYSIVKKKENLIRDRYEKKFLLFAIRNKIPILAVCRGFQLVSKFFKCKIYKISKHVGTTHSLNINKNILKNKVKRINVNSYHNYAIYNLPKHFNLIIRSKDKSIEIAKSEKYKILCFMSHPERPNLSQKLIKKIIYSHFYIK